MTVAEEAEQEMKQEAPVIIADVPELDIVFQITDCTYTEMGSIADIDRIVARAFGITKKPMGAKLEDGELREMRTFRKEMANAGLRRVGRGLLEFNMKITAATANQYVTSFNCRGPNGQWPGLGFKSCCRIKTCAAIFIKNIRPEDMSSPELDREFGTLGINPISYIATSDGCVVAFLNSLAEVELVAANGLVIGRSFGVEVGPVPKELAYILDDRVRISCRKCGNLGHFAKDCKRSQACRWCGGSKCKPRNCEEKKPGKRRPPFCVACYGGQHVLHGFDCLAASLGRHSRPKRAPPPKVAAKPKPVPHPQLTAPKKKKKKSRKRGRPASPPKRRIKQRAAEHVVRMDRSGSSADDEDTSASVSESGDPRKSRTYWTKELAQNSN